MILESFFEDLADKQGYLELALILMLVYYAMLVTAQWKLFEKAGEKGWKALIPFYNMFVSHHLIGMRHIWFILDIIFWVIEVVLEFIKETPVWIEDSFFSVALLFTIVSEILHIIKLCYCYTKSELFGIGLFLIPPLFSMILAFDKNSEYHPPRPHRDRELAQKVSDT